MHRSLGEDRLEVVLDSVLRQEHQASQLIGVDPSDQMIEEFALPACRGVGGGEQQLPRSAGELSSKVTAMSRASGGRESSIRAAAE